eukprot:scaffold4284_cov113-Isochrysis_galbana.AAC.13
MPPFSILRLRCENSGWRPQLRRRAPLVLGSGAHPPGRNSLAVPADGSPSHPGVVVECGDGELSRVPPQASRGARLCVGADWLVVIHRHKVHTGHTTGVLEVQARAVRMRCP